MTTSVPFWRLVAEDLKALPRARYALAGAAALAGLLMLLAAVVGTSPNGLWDFALMAYGIMPALLAGFCAHHVASLRTTRFGQALYTTPVRAVHVLGARVVVGLVLAAAYLGATLPFLAVAARHVELEAGVLRALVAGAAILVFCVAFGVMLGVLMGTRSAVAPTVVAVGFMLLSFFAMVSTMSAMAFNEQGMDEPLLRTLHVSPHLLVADATDLLTHYTGLEARSAARSGLLFAAETLACLGIAAWAYLRAQTPDGWDVPRGRRAALVVAVTLVLLAPAATADTKYVEAPRGAQMYRGWSVEANGTDALLVERGERPASFGKMLAGTDDDPLDAERRNVRDLLILLKGVPNAPLYDVTVTLRGEARLRVSPAAADLGDIPSPTRGPGDKGAVLRIPVTLTPLDARDLGHNFASLDVDVTYRLSEDGELRTATWHGAVRSDIPWVKARMAAAGAPLFLVTALAGAVRARRTLLGGS